MLRSPPWVTLNGKPERIERMPLVCQPPIICFVNPDRFFARQFPNEVGYEVMRLVKAETAAVAPPIQRVLIGRLLPGRHSLRRRAPCCRCTPLPRQDPWRNVDPTSSAGRGRTIPHSCRDTGYSPVPEFPARAERDRRTSDKHGGIECPCIGRWRSLVEVPDAIAQMGTFTPDVGHSQSHVRE